MIKVDEKDKNLVVKKTSKKPNIGICWSASVTGESYDGKVFDLKYFDDLINSESFNVYSFQVGEGSSGIKKYGYENKIIDLLLAPHSASGPYPASFRNLTTEIKKKK